MARRGGMIGGGRGRTPMDRAAEGLTQSAEALTAIYNAGTRVLPEAVQRVDTLLALAERAVVALEKVADKKAPLDRE